MKRVWTPVRIKMKNRRLPALHDSAYLARFMTGLHEDQRKLNEIQSAYDNLALPGRR